MVSRLRYIAKLVVKNSFLTQLLFNFFTQLIIHAPSSFSIKQSKSLANLIYLESNSEHLVRTNRILKTLTLLRCFELPDREFIRIGPLRDGGYVIHKNIERVNKIFSIGVAEDTSFEEDFMKLLTGTQFFLFDHTVTPKRKLPPNFNFYSLGLGKRNESNFVTLDRIVDLHLKNGENALLKIDIEGAEYEALSETSSEVFAKFDQLVIELHDIDGDKLCSDLFIKLIEKIRNNFFLIHIHGNNNTGYVATSGISLPQTLELTFLSKKFNVTQVPGSAVFPRSMDYPCTSGDELIIGTFKFPDSYQTQ